MKNKLTPQEFLDSTEFNYLAHCPQHRHNRRKSVRVLLSMITPFLSREFEDYWTVVPIVVRRGCVGSLRLDAAEYDAIDWTGFDYTKPLERTKCNAINDENGPYICPFCKMQGIVGLRELQDHLDFKCKFFNRMGD
jgi:hypothetical protein